MANTWTAFDFKTKLVDQVIAAIGVYDPVPRVLVYFPSVDEPLTDSIIVGHTITDINEPVVIGANRYDETVNVECQIRVVRPGAGDTPAKDAEARAADLLGEIDTQVRTNRPTVGNQTLSAAIAARTASLFAWQADVAIRVALIDFTVTYRARTSDT